MVRIEKFQKCLSYCVNNYVHFIQHSTEFCIMFLLNRICITFSDFLFSSWLGFSLMAATL